MSDDERGNINRRGSDGSDGVAEDVVVREMESESGLASRIEGSFSSCP